MTHDALIVFIKAPRTGTVKTRLASALGVDLATELYRALAEIEIRNTDAPSAVYRRVLYYAPADAGAELAAWLPLEATAAQHGADLGQRMAAAFDETFARGARRAAIIGTDVPWLTRGHVTRALDSLDDHDLAVGPARDGGYYLLALDRPRPELFEAVAWSTGSVLATTLERAAGLGLRVHRLEPLPDLDTPDDLEREWPRLKPLLADAALAARLEQALSR